MDFCPECGAAVDVRLLEENHTIQFICRNPQCPKYGQVLNSQREGDGLSNG